MSSTNPTAATEQSLADLVTTLPGAARVLERHGLDYCCGGQRSLAEAAADAGVDPDEVIDELHAIGPSALPDWAAMTATELVDHIEDTHHAYLRDELPRLGALAAKVAGVHGSRHPELADVQRTFQELQADLEPHLLKEEHVLFPAIRELDAAGSHSFGFGSVGNPISVMLREHDQVGELLARLRELTGGYRTPPDGCASYAALYTGLAEIEEDTHLHVHKENNVLFPLVLELESAGTASRP